MRLWTDQQVTVRLDLTAEIAEDLATTLELKPSRKHVVARQDGCLGLEPMWLMATVRTGNIDSLNQSISHDTHLPNPSVHFPPHGSITRLWKTGD
ncbi:MAG: hypothetical protein NVS1B3_09510 [Candidatus Dormibacteraceae bacterium]